MSVTEVVDGKQLSQQGTGGDVYTCARRKGNCMGSPSSLLLYNFSYFMIGTTILNQGLNDCEINAIKNFEKGKVVLQNKIKDLMSSQQNGPTNQVDELQGIVQDIQGKVNYSIKDRRYLFTA